MKIDDLVPNTDDMVVSKKVLRDCNFHLENNKVTAFCANAAEAAYLELMFKDDFLRALSAKKGRQYTLEIIRTYIPPSIPINAHEKGKLDGTASLNYTYLFDTFIAGESNKAALTAAMNFVSAKPYQTTSPNFLYIHGSLGIGKTHLLHSILHDLLDRGKNIAFFNSSDLADHVLKGIHHGGEEYLEQMEIFRESDVLAVDDIGFLRTMPRMQIEMKGVLDHLISSGKMAVFTGSVLPSDPEFRLIPELSSRLMTGMVVKIEPPDKRLRRDIFEGQFSQRRIFVRPEALDYLVEAPMKNVRDVLSVTNYISNHVAMDGEPVSLEKVAQFLRDLKISVPSDSQRLVTKIMENMHVVFTLEDLQRPRLDKEMRIIRENIVWELYKGKGVRQMDIARAMQMKPQYVSKIILKRLRQ